MAKACIAFGMNNAAEAWRQRSGADIEDCFPGRYLVQDDRFAPHWEHSTKEEG